jgi:hypothetical protein
MDQEGYERSRVSTPILFIFRLFTSHFPPSSLGTASPVSSFPYRHGSLGGNVSPRGEGWVEQVARK